MDFSLTTKTARASHHTHTCGTFLSATNTLVILNGHNTSKLLYTTGCGFLSFMGMLIPSIDLSHVFNKLPPQLVYEAACPKTARRMTRSGYFRHQIFSNQTDLISTGITGVPIIALILQTLLGKSQLAGVQHDNNIAHVNTRCISGFYAFPNK